MPDVDFAALRRLLLPLIDTLGSCTHRELDTRFAELGLVEPPQAAGSSRSRAQRVKAVAAGLRDADLTAVARRVLSAKAASPTERIAIEDILWAASGAPPIPKRTRREIAARLPLEELDFSDNIRSAPRHDRHNPQSRRPTCVGGSRCHRTIRNTGRPSSSPNISSK
jgi:hypothetical protein